MRRQQFQRDDFQRGRAMTTFTRSRLRTPKSTQRHLVFWAGLGDGQGGDS
jgi:hypothetical protein